MNNRSDIDKSNSFLIKLLEKDKPFIISRCGIGGETGSVYYYKRFKHYDKTILSFLVNNAGIYNININTNFVNYCDMFWNCIQNSSALAIIDSPQIREEQKYFVNTFKLSTIHSRVLEPFYCCLENIKPWSHSLIGKKVLIINPFTDSMQKQLANKFQIFKDPEKKIFLDEQEFVFYKSFQTSGGNHIHSNWLETYTIMCNDIKKLDFDIALLACGGYGLPLCNFINKDLKKSAIYVGGGLQLLFGIMGKRWENNDMWKQIIADNDCQFIRPSGDEIMPNITRIEGGCYW